MGSQNLGGHEHTINIEDLPRPPPTNQTASSSSSNVSLLDSGLWISVQLILSATQIVSSVATLWIFREHKLRVSHNLFTWVVGYASACALMLHLLYFQYRTARTRSLRNALSLFMFSILDSPSNETENQYRLVQFLKMAMNCFFLAWLIFGCVSIPGTIFYVSGASFFETSCVVLFLTVSFVLAIPAMTFASVCLYLPCLVWAILVYRRGERSRANRELEIAVLPVYKFEAKEIGRGEVILGAGTMKERSLSGEDAVCCICLGHYADNEELRKLPCCGHFFHVECVDKWLKVKARCPLCQCDLNGASTS